MKCPSCGMEWMSGNTVCECGAWLTKPSAASAGSTALYAVELTWESGRKESQLVDAKNEHDAVLKAMLMTFGLSKIDATCVR